MYFLRFLVLPVVEVCKVHVQHDLVVPVEERGVRGFPHAALETAQHTQTFEGGAQNGEFVVSVDGRFNVID